ncbi:uncharacterized protein LOC134288167 [Aedes albopictus]|uniref:Endonuclease/exonuclease/phosphatase domain-containing protein n=1 Tax=Aedes albopictus TaxID=7160 RepID=A0ABM1Y8H5_AEDAL
MTSTTTRRSVHGEQNRFNTRPPGSIPSTSALDSPGRTSHGIMEAPDPSNSVEPCCQRQLSRPGPVVETEERGFHRASPGKYPNISIASRSDSSSVPSIEPLPPALELACYNDSESSPHDADPNSCLPALPTSSRSSSFAPSATTRTNVSPASASILMYYQNVGGINSSIAEYQSAISDGCYDVYALCETWLNENTSTSQLFDDSYSVYRQDRSPSNSNKSSGGGVLLAVRSCFKSRVLNPPGGPMVEQLWIAITTADATLYLCLVYIPPDRVNDGDMIENHLTSLDWVVAQLGPRDNVIIVGDFNLSAISWQRTSCGYLFPISSRSSISAASRQLLDAYSTARLRQLNGVENENNRILDLCFFSEEISMDGVVMQAPSPLVKICRHHPPVLARMEISPQIRFCDTVENVSYDYSKADFNKINDFLAHVDWDDVFRDLDANLAASTLSGILWYAIDQYVPTKSERAAPKPAWSNADLRCLKRLKKAALRRHSKHRTDATRAVYLEVNTEYKKLVSTMPIKSVYKTA